MAGKKRKRTRNKTPQMKNFVVQRLREGLIIAVLAGALFLLLSLVTYHRSDPSWSNLVNTPQVQNAAGLRRRLDCRFLAVLLRQFILLNAFFAAV